MGPPMGVIERLTDWIVDSDLPLDLASLERSVPGIVREQAPLSHPGTAQEVIDMLIGLGPVEPLLRDDRVTDVLINGPSDIWVDRDGSLEKVDTEFPDAASLAAAIERVISPLGLSLDHASPMVDARLRDGSRLHAALPPVAVDGPVVAIRRFRNAFRDLDDLVESGGIRPDGAELLRRAVADRLTILVVGGTGAGKTTLLNLLSREIPSGERVVAVEDAAELALAGHVVRLEARSPNAEGRGEVDLRQLVRAALRLRPDRLVVGEVRGPEALELVTALNTGHTGSLATVHANSAEEALLRLETLALMEASSISATTISRQLHAAIQLVVLVVRDRSSRYVSTISGLEARGLVERYRR